MTDDDLASLERIERRLENCLRDLRIFRADQQKMAQGAGVLGSRGLTQFVLDMLRQTAPTGIPIAELLLAAEVAGYAIPTARTLSKRLTERAYRVGDVAWHDNFWYWKGTGGN